MPWRPLIVLAIVALASARVVAQFDPYSDPRVDDDSWFWTNGSTEIYERSLSLGDGPPKGDEGWADGFNLPGVFGGASTVVIGPDGNVYVSGFWTPTVGNVFANGIAAWDGVEWHAFGRGIEDGGVLAIAVDSSGRVFAGGEFTLAGGAPAQNIAVWSEGKWSPLAEGTNGPVESLKYSPDGTLYVGGRFTRAGNIPATGIARWTGEAWESVGSGVHVSSGAGVAEVSAMAFGRDSTLFAGGYFSSAGSAATYNIAAWNGSDWMALGNQYIGQVETMAVGPSGTLYVGGYSNEVHAWDGATWKTLGTGFDANGLAGRYASIHALAVGADETVYAGGHFGFADGRKANMIAAWDGTSWNSVGQRIGDPVGLEENSDNGVAVRGLAVHPNGSLFACGWLYSLENGPALLMWNGLEWHVPPSGSGVNGSVLALASIRSGRVVAGGDFTYVGGKRINRIALWDRNHWEALGTGIGETLDDEVRALAFGLNGTLYAAGRFEHAGETAAVNIARWSDDQEWHGLGAGLNGHVNTLATGRDGLMYAGGYFTGSGSTSLKRIAAWDGNEWIDLAGGVDGSSVQALVVAPDGTLYVGGSFRKAGDVTALNVAAWDGRSWTALGTGTNLPVHSLAVSPDGRLYAAGQFTRAGSIDGTGATVWKNVYGLGVWDGEEWKAVDEGQEYPGFSYSTHQSIVFDKAGVLYAAVSPWLVTELKTEGILAWDGESWRGLGSGVERPPGALLIGGDDRLYVGGSFWYAGRRPASGFSIFQGSIPRAVGTENETPTSASSLSDLSVYPSPFSGTGRITLTLPQSSDIDVGVFDMLGRRVESIFRGPVASEVPLTLSVRGDDLATGTYFVHVSGAGVNVTRKFVVVD